MTTNRETQGSDLRRRIYRFGSATLIVLIGSIILDARLVPLALAIRKGMKIQFGTAEILAAALAVVPIITMLLLLLLMIRDGLRIRKLSGS